MNVSLVAIETRVKHLGDFGSKRTANVDLDRFVRANTNFEIRNVHIAIDVEYSAVIIGVND
jgi:hypothetical protein